MDSWANYGYEEDIKIYGSKRTKKIIEKIILAIVTFVLLTYVIIRIYYVIVYAMWT